MGLADKISERDVVDPETFATWAQQVTGVPYPNLKNMMVLRKHLKRFFEQNPQYDYRALCRTVSWAHSRKRRHADVWRYISEVRWAFKAGALSDLIVVKHEEDSYLSGLIRDALAMEDRQEWRYRLCAASGDAAKGRVYDEWVASRG